MFSEVKKYFILGDCDALGKVSSSLRTTLLKNVRDVNIPLCLQSGAMKQDQEAEKFIPRDFICKQDEGYSVLALQ